MRIGGDLELTQVVTALCETAVPRVADLAAAYLYEAVLTDGDLPEAPAARRRPAPGRGLARPPGARRDARPQGRRVRPDRAVRLDGLQRAARDVARPRDARPRDEDVALPAAVRLAGLAARRRRCGRASSCSGSRSSCAVPRRAPFDETDMLTATLMADQAALGVHKALLYQREARVADALQRSMLPKHPPRLPGVEVAYRYLPGNPAAQVGGDWFDAIPLPGSRVALVVGDVMGHGVHSAATMGQLRTAVRTLAALDPPPGPGAAPPRPALRRHRRPVRGAVPRDVRLLRVRPGRPALRDRQRRARAARSSSTPTADAS